jgi:hypothetical protein
MTGGTSLLLTLSNSVLMNNASFVQLAHTRRFCLPTTAAAAAIATAAAATTAA